MCLCSMSARSNPQFAIYNPQSRRFGCGRRSRYENLTWLCHEQERIERRLFAVRRGDRKPELFLYDVTSSYLESKHNELGAYGYNRGGKKGELQIVIGLLCDASGEPVSTEVLEGNTTDPRTFGAQVEKAAQRFGCERVTFVGDRGRIKRGQIETLAKVGFHAIPTGIYYITAITKPQITKLIHEGVLQMEWFDETVCEVQDDGVRYCLRRNPRRAEEIAVSREDKRRRVQTLVDAQVAYLRDHPRAAVTTAKKHVQQKLSRLRMDAWLRVETEGRHLRLVVDDPKLAEAARLDGCYVIQTDLPQEAADKQVVHDRYKDLAEWSGRFGRARRGIFRSGRCTCARKRILAGTSWW